jgi:hypothetical protein
VLLITGCTYQAAIRQLTPQEQATFGTYRKVMTGSQRRTYLGKPGAAARAAYLSEIGLTQRFQALSPQDREAILHAYIRKGMSADALRFLWGEPEEIEGYINHYEYWFYQGWSLTLAATGNIQVGAITEVYLVDGQVVWWRDVVPDDDEESDEDGDGDLGRSRS